MEVWPSKAPKLSSINTFPNCVAFYQAHYDYAFTNYRADLDNAKLKTVRQNATFLGWDEFNGRYTSEKVVWRFDHIFWCLNRWVFELLLLHRMVFLPSGLVNEVKICAESHAGSEQRAWVIWGKAMHEIIRTQVSQVRSFNGQRNRENEDRKVQWAGKSKNWNIELLYVRIRCTIYRYSWYCENIHDETIIFRT
jgi:hypothetical protein